MAWHDIIQRGKMWGVARGGGSKRSALAGAHRCADGEAGVANAAVLGTVGWAHQGTIVTERGRRAAARAGAPFARVREARLVGRSNGAALSKHCAFAPHNQNRQS